MVRLFESATPPTTGNSDDALSVGLEFFVTEAAEASGVWFWQPSTGTVSTAVRTCGIYELAGEVGGVDTGTLLYSGPFTPSGSGWQRHKILDTIPLNPAKRYKAVVHHPSPAGYPASGGYFNSGGPGENGFTNDYLTAPGQAGSDSSQGTFVYGASIAFPTQVFNSGNYWVDIETRKSPTKAVAYGENGLAGSGAQFVASVTVPAGIAVGDWMLAMVSWASGATTVLDKTGWQTVLVETQAQNMWTAVLAKQYTGGATVDINIGNGTYSRLWAGIAFYDGTMVSGIETIGGSGTRGGVSQAFVTAPALTAADLPRYAVNLATTRSIAATTADSITATGFDFFLDAVQKTPDTGGNASLIAFSNAEIPSTSVPAVTTTFNGSSTNALSMTVVLQPLVASESGIVQTALTSGFEDTALQVGAVVSQGSTIRIAVATDAALTTPTFFDATISASNWITARATGLTPNTKYFIGFEIDGVIQTDYQLTAYTTGPDVPWFKVIAGSCQQTGSNHASLARAATENARFLCHMGDLHYADALDETTWRNGTFASLSSANMKATLKALPIDYIWDNHDRIINDDPDTDEVNNGTTNPATVTALRELVGSASYPAADAQYRTWRIGRVRFLHTDNWTLRTDPDAVDPDPEFVWFNMVGATGTLVTTSNSDFSVVNRDNGTINYLETKGIVFTSDSDGSYTIARGLGDAAHNTYAFRMKFSVNDLPAANLNIGSVRNNTNDTFVAKLILQPSGQLQLWDSANTNLGTLATLTTGQKYTVSLRLVVDTVATGSVTADIYLDAGTTSLGTVTSTTANLGTLPIGGFEIGILSTNANSTVNWFDVKAKSNRVTELPEEAPPPNEPDMWGEVQLQWFKDTLLAAQEPVIVWFCSFPNHNAQNGRWNSFEQWTLALDAWLANHPGIKKRLICVGGDSHDIKADSGTRTVGRVEDGSPHHNFIGVPTLNASGFDQGSNTLWDTGNWDIANMTTGAGGASYSRMTFEDDGHTVKFLWQAINGSTGEIRATYTREIGTIETKTATGRTPSIILSRVNDPRRAVGAAFRIKADRVHPTIATVGLAGLGLTEADLTPYSPTPGDVAFSTGTHVIEDRIINGALVVNGTAQVTARRCKINGRVDSDSVNASLVLEDCFVDASTWTNAATGFQNLTARRCDLRGGVTAVNASQNVTVIDSMLHEGYLPPTGDWHMGGFLSNGGNNILVENCTIICNEPLNVDGGGPSGTAQLYGDFAILHHITFDHCFFAATTGAYVTSFGYDPGWVESGGTVGKQYGAETHHITVKNCTWERGPGGIYQGGTVATTSSWPALDPDSVWLNNAWDDGTPISTDE